jgi:hypothetical protein
MVTVVAIVNAVRTGHLTRPLAHGCAAVLHQFWPVCCIDPIGKALIETALQTG